MTELSAWHARHMESVLAADLPIVDAHHHMWHRPPERYQLDEILMDVSSGHNVRATVFVECSAMYRTEGAEHLRPVGETEYVNGAAAASASGIYGPVRLCAGISGFADLRRGAGVREVLEAHIRAGGDRFRGIRQQAQFDPVLGSLAKRPTQKGLLLDPRFQEGFAELAPLGLIYEVWVFFTQLDDVAALAVRFPETVIVLNHLGGPIAVGPYAGDKPANFRAWRAGMEKLAKLSNVRVKLGGLGMVAYGFDFHLRETPPDSETLATAWAPHVETCISLFGADRCMFESNFPVDAQSCSYAALWNAFKRLTRNAGPAERSALFSATAARTYGLTI